MTIAFPPGTPVRAIDLPFRRKGRAVCHRTTIDGRVVRLAANAPIRDQLGHYWVQPERDGNPFGGVLLVHEDELEVIE